MELLLSCGANPCQSLEDGCTALYTAAWQGQLEALKLLVGAGANVNVADKVRTRYLCQCSAHVCGWHPLLAQDGDTPLHTAARKGHVACLKFLLAYELEGQDSDSSPTVIIASVPGEQERRQRVCEADAGSASTPAPSNTSGGKANTKK